MKASTLICVLLGAWVAAQGCWILFVRPDPPPGARTATRTTRRIIATGNIIIGLSLIAFILS